MILPIILFAVGLSSASCSPYCIVYVGAASSIKFPIDFNGLRKCAETDHIDGFPKSWTIPMKPCRQECGQFLDPDGTKVNHPTFCQSFFSGGSEEGTQLIAGCADCGDLRNGQATCDAASARSSGLVLGQVKTEGNDISCPCDNRIGQEQEQDQMGCNNYRCEDLGDWQATCGETTKGGRAYGKCNDFYKVYNSAVANRNIAQLGGYDVQLADACCIVPVSKNECFYYNGGARPTYPMNTDSLDYCIMNPHTNGFPFNKACKQTCESMLSPCASGVLMKNIPSATVWAHRCHDPEAPIGTACDGPGGSNLCLDARIGKYTNGVECKCGTYFSEIDTSAGNHWGPSAWIAILLTVVFHTNKALCRTD